MHMRTQNINDEYRFHTFKNIACIYTQKYETVLNYKNVGSQKNYKLIDQLIARLDSEHR